MNSRQPNTTGLGSEDPGICSADLARIFMAAPDTEAGLEDIAACLNAPDESVRILSVEALSKWEAKAVPFILKALAPEQPEPVRVAAASALGRIGTEAETAVLPLSSCLESDNDLLLWHSGFALAKIGSPAIPELKNKLVSDNPKTVIAAVRSLGWMGKEADQAVETIQAIETTNKTPELTLVCACTLVRITGDTEKGLVPIFLCLEQADAELKKTCIRELGLLGEQAKGAQEKLIPLLVDTDPEIRSETALALARIGNPSKDLAQALIPLLSDENKEVRVNTCIALSAYGPDANAALPDLKAMAEDKDPQLSVIALKVIEALEGNAKAGGE